MSGTARRPCPVRLGHGICFFCMRFISYADVLDSVVGHGSTVWGVATDPQGSRIASVSDDKSVIIWQRDPNSKDVHADGR